MIVILTVIPILIIVLSVIYIGKNILINYRLSNNGLKNAFVAILLCVIVWTSGQGAILGAKMMQVQDVLENMISNEEEYTQGDIKVFEASISTDKSDLRKYTVVSCVSFGIFILLTRNISKEIKNRPTTSKWDLSKFK